MSSPSPERLRAWRLFLESGLALQSVLDAELEHEVGLTLRWYDVLIHLEESPEGIPMSELAGRILHSKSGFTRVVDRMEDAGLVRRERPEHDRRSILVVLTDKGAQTITAPAATTETESNDTSPNTSPMTRSKPSPAPSRKSAHTPARSAPAASAANPDPARDRAIAIARRTRHSRPRLARQPLRAYRGSVPSAPTDVVRSGPKVQRVALLLRRRCGHRSQTSASGVTQARGGAAADDSFHRPAVAELASAMATIQVIAEDRPQVLPCGTAAPARSPAPSLRPRRCRRCWPVNPSSIRSSVRRRSPAPRPPRAAGDSARPAA